MRRTPLRDHLLLNTRSGITHARREGDAIDHQYNLCGSYRRPATKMPVEASVFRSLQRLTNWQMCTKCDRKLAAGEAKDASTRVAVACGEVAHVE